jgi:hypothetical protein
MPEMELGEMPATNMSRAEFAAAACDVHFRIWGYIRWPSNEAARRQFAVQCSAQLFQRLGEVVRLNDLGDNVLINEARRIVRQDFERGGGLDVLPLSRNDSTPPIPAAGWDAVATLLFMIHAIASSSLNIRGGGSINKAVFLMERYQNISRKQIWNIWRQLKSVSHLCSAVRDFTWAGSPSGGSQAKNRPPVQTLLHYDEPLLLYLEKTAVRLLEARLLSASMDSVFNNDGLLWGEDPDAGRLTQEPDRIVQREWQRTALLLARARQYEDFLLTHEGSHGAGKLVSVNNLWRVPSFFTASDEIVDAVRLRPLPAATLAKLLAPLREYRAPMSV